MQLKETESLKLEAMIYIILEGKKEDPCPCLEWEGGEGRGGEVLQVT